MSLSVIIITKNEEKTIEDCINSVKNWADEVIVIDSFSKDKTVKIAKSLGAKVFLHQFKDFSSQREFGLQKAKGEWVLYLDADERVTASLRDEIKNKILKIKNANKKSKIKEKIVAYRVKRKNFYLGNFEWPMVEKIDRLFLRKALKGWRGAVHESPIVDGKVGELKNCLLHYTHQDLSSMVEKTNQWSEIEAEMLFKSGHPKMTWWRFLRVMLTKFWQSFVGQGGWKIGTPGLIESLYQAFSYFIIYTKLWEKQQK